ncbi:unnamed protein product [Protopolystoma xenopodis]|uniref:Uncharacterized protein n=1 Tax=Protopolystoma xenopodis TaxID=117903 RepID=A0A3S5AYE7_9PLAT|nr:unnamed protein product [Protopolystoma xenopodis]
MTSRHSASGLVEVGRAQGPRAKEALRVGLLSSAPSKKKRHPFTCRPRAQFRARKIGDEKRDQSQKGRKPLETDNPTVLRRRDATAHAEDMRFRPRGVGKRIGETQFWRELDFRATTAVASDAKHKTSYY